MVAVLCAFVIAFFVRASNDWLVSVGEFGVTNGVNFRNVTKARSTKKVLIAAYYRSGSSLTGSVFAENPDAFYLFEPLNPLHQITVPNMLNLTYFDGSSRQCPLDPKSLQQASVAVLEAFFSCRLATIDVTTMTHLNCKKHRNRVTSDYCACKARKAPREVLAQCIPDFTKKCLAAKLRVIKTIRTNMETAHVLLTEEPDVKVIHLLRDPRGMISGDVYSHTRDVNELSIQTLCETLTTDVEAFRMLQTQHPGSFLQVVYEDIVANVTRVTRTMYEFVDTSLPNSAEAIMHNKTGAGRVWYGPYGTYRKDGLATAYRWRSVIPWHHVEIIQKHCSTVLTEGRYPVFSGEKELKSYRIPDRGKEDAHNSEPMSDTVF